MENWRKMQICLLSDERDNRGLISTGMFVTSITTQVRSKHTQWLAIETIWNHSLNFIGRNVFKSFRKRVYVHKFGINRPIRYKISINIQGRVSDYLHFDMKWDAFHLPWKVANLDTNYRPSFARKTPAGMGWIPSTMGLAIDSKTQAVNKLTNQE